MSRLTKKEQQQIADEEFDWYLETIKEEDAVLVSHNRTLIEQPFTFTDSGTLVLEIPFGESKEIFIEDALPDTDEPEQ